MDYISVIKILYTENQNIFISGISNNQMKVLNGKLKKYNEKNKISINICFG